VPTIECITHVPRVESVELARVPADGIGSLTSRVPFDAC